jgi:membrane protease YdiL (CAAX protease family)
MMANKISLTKAISIFAIATVYFYAILFTLLPFLRKNFVFNSALYWFITGYFLFIPLLLFAVFMVKSEGNKNIKQIVLSLNILPFSKKDWAYSIFGLLVAFILTGIIFAIWSVLNKNFEVTPLNTTPWFMEMHPFKGSDTLLLLIWFPMFLFNIVGEEILWRGYIQKRLQIKYSWIICSLLWLIFHLPFGVGLLIMLIPIILIIPYAFYKTQNTSVGIFIHGIYNGPVFIAVALGFIK